jgi:hypothetical protein
MCKLITSIKKSTALELTVKKWFNENKFETPSANLLSDSYSYIPASTIKALYREWGGDKLPDNLDKAEMADMAMGADFFLDCGRHITICDVTAETRKNQMERKYSRLVHRLELAMQNNLSITSYSNIKNKKVNKPIKRGVIVAVQRYDELDIEKMLDVLDSKNPVSIYK